MKRSRFQVTLGSGEPSDRVGNPTIERRRERFAKTIRQARKAYERGEVTRGSVGALVKELSMT